MIGWDDIYKVVVATVPLYFALILGYGSVKWWHMFTPEQSDAINRMNCYFILPLFTFQFTAHINPFKMNRLFIAADVISKAIVGVSLAIWAYCCHKKKNFDWSITGFSLFTLNNTLVVGVPLMSAMYGPLGGKIVIQSSILQSIIWFMVLLFMLEFRRTRQQFNSSTVVANSEKNLEGNNNVVFNDNSEGNNNDNDNDNIGRSITRPSFWLSMKLVWRKLAKNPNSYACVAGLVWAFLSNRWAFEMPSIVEGSILIMSRAGSGTSMFCMGLFMASQQKVIACGVGPTMLGLVLRFVGGPFVMAIACIAVRLHGNVLRIAIIQAALPQSITSFIYAKEYALHANVISTAVIFGTVASLPILIAYYAVLDLAH